MLSRRGRAFAGARRYAPLSVSPLTWLREEPRSTRTNLSMADTLNPTAADDTADDATMVAERTARLNNAKTVLFKSDPWEEDEYSPEEYEAMLEMYDETLSSIEEGEIVTARVLRVTDSMVILDVGFKSEGSVARDEFKDPDALQP